MKLRLKVLLLIGSLGLIITLGVFFYSRAALLEDYKSLESRELIHDTIQARNVFRNMFTTLKLLTANWSSWDDLYSFMKNKNQAFINSNLAPSTFENSNINLILFYDTQGKLFYGLNYNPDTKKLSPPPENLINLLKTESPLTNPEKLGKGNVGILKTENKYVALSAMPILTSLEKGPPAGTLMFGYFLNEKQILNLSEIIATRVEFFPLPLQTHNPILKNALLQLQKGTEYYFSAVDDTHAYGFVFIRDINNNPIGILQVSSSREIYTQGLKTIDRYLLIIVGIAILFMVSIWYLLKIFVLDRIINVSTQVMDIYSGSKFSKHISLEGKDEIGHMVSTINALMDIIQLSEEQLKYRISLRSDELEKISHLNKNLLSEINQQKEAETKLREEEKILRHLAYYDIVTGLPNRIYFNELLHHLLLQANRNDERFAVLFIDVDHFKQINDTYGHDIGDKILKHTATQLKKSVRENDIVARLAGDEFIIILKHLHKKALITSLTEKMLQLLAEPLVIDEKAIRSTYSIGISIYPEDGRNAETIQKHADLAMYYAKKQNGNIYCYYDETKSPSIA